LAAAPTTEEIYWRGRYKREERLKALNYNISAIEPFNHSLGTYIWDWFTPDYNCPSLQRVGQLGDGGKWVCRIEELQKKKPCVIYSFGVRDDISFEMESWNRTGCVVYAFDPTVEGLPEAIANNLSFPIIYHKEALGPVSGPTKTFMLVRSLYDIMRHYGHDFIDVLKVEISPFFPPPSQRILILLYTKLLLLFLW